MRKSVEKEKRRIVCDKMAKINVGVVGLGDVSNAHLAGYKSLENVEIFFCS